MKKSIRKHWNSSFKKPTRKGWYECRARDGRWDGGVRYRSWGNGSWWIPMPAGDSDTGWLSSPMGLYRWRGPCIGLDTKLGLELEKHGGIRA